MLKKYNKAFRFLISMIWFINGLFCKLLNFVPRHEMIVERILHLEDGRLFTILIGLGEVLIGIWILTGIKPKINSYFQILIVASMNILEFILVPDLLMWGSFNSLFALLFIIAVFMVEKHNTEDEFT